MKRKVPPKNLCLLMLCSILLFCSQHAFSQKTKSISGHVKDEKGATIPGVSVMIQGSKEGTTTDADGYYKINVPEKDAVLVFSFVGYEKKAIHVDGNWNGDVWLKDKGSTELDEVVVIGYGTRKKADLTGAVVTIKGEELEKSPVANVSNALAGAMPGLIVNTYSGEPGNDNANIFVRGQGTLNSNLDQPL